MRVYNIPSPSPALAVDALGCAVVLIVVVIIVLACPAAFAEAYLALAGNPFLEDISFLLVCCFEVEIELIYIHTYVQTYIRAYIHTFYYNHTNKACIKITLIKPV